MPNCKKCGKPVKSAVVMHSACAEVAIGEVMEIACIYCVFRHLFSDDACALFRICNACEIDTKLRELFVKGGDPV